MAIALSGVMVGSSACPLAMRRTRRAIRKSLYPSSGSSTSAAARPVGLRLRSWLMTYRSRNGGTSLICGISGYRGILLASKNPAWFMNSMTSGCGNSPNIEDQRTVNSANACMGVVDSFSKESNLGPLNM